MTQVRIQRPLAKSFNNFVDDFFNEMPSIVNNNVVAPILKNTVPVNITETKTDYVLEVVAPGFEKENFKIDLENNALQISGERKEATENADDRKVRKEFAFRSFKRSFTVDEKIDGNNITARYSNGVLVLNLPKKVEVKDPAKNITVA